MRSLRGNKTSCEFIVSVFFLFTFWMIIFFPSNLCSKLGIINLIEHLILGLIFAIIITYFYPQNIFNHQEIIKYTNLRTLSRLCMYFGQLTIEILLAGIDVARRVMRRKLVISPGIVEVVTPLQADDEIALNANSITLTPGTITIDVQKIEKGSIFLVHCISQEAVKGMLETGGFVEKIMNIYEKDLKND